MTEILGNSVGRIYYGNHCLNPSKRREAFSKEALDGREYLISTLVIHLSQRGGRRKKRERKRNHDNPIGPIPDTKMRPKTHNLV